MTADAVLDVREVSKSFGGFRALDDLSIDLKPGEIHAIIGPNGAGKSTLLNVISGLLAPNAGEVVFEGQTITRAPAHQRARMGLARSFQITSIFVGYTAFENVRLALMAQRGECRQLFRPIGRRLSKETMALLDHVQIAALADRPAGELAAGDRKRLEFAIALAGDPRVMLLDEPTAGMSASEREIVVGIIRRLSGERGISVLFTEHDIDMVFDNAHRITVMHQGRRLAQGAPKEVRDDQRVREVYLGDSDDAHL